MLEYTITSESRGIRLVFKAESNLAKTHTVQVQATNLANNFTWTFSYTTCHLDSETSVIEFAKLVVSTRSKSFWTAAANSIKKEIAERKSRFRDTMEFFEFQSTELEETANETFGSYYNRVGKNRMYCELLSLGTVSKCVDSIIACL